ncbi:unnamed protein product [Cyclocybe aegerita]|uniref:HMG box domain-containing protein n=1 Tax=Cyclocybe aegerita TaxID=1973307 RepID=A0A8S0WG43_CYCAE|nr:unnamed protein product [Cyclocybe aegerita]
MPAVRLTRARRKSSHTLFTPAKAGIYGIQARPVTFAPNVTPVTYVEPDDDLPASPEASSPTAALFPPSETPAPPPARKRCPPGKRRSQGYIPRPPNAFMLFRADFVRQKHVPGSIETNHGSLSKIIGNCWRQLPLEEKRVWEVKAKQEKANHKAMFPNYRFRPVHNKNKNKDGSAGSTSTSTGKKEKPQQTVEEELRCDQVALLLLNGMKGEELAQAVRSLDMDREREGTEGLVSARGSFSHGHGQHNLSASQSPFDSPLPQDFMPLTLSQPQAQYASSGTAHLVPGTPPLVVRPAAERLVQPRCFLLVVVVCAFARTSFSSMGFSSSFNPTSTSNTTNIAHPQPQTIALPSVTFMSQSRPASPVNSISRQTLGQRRASSAQPMGFNNAFMGRRSWTMPAYGAGFNNSTFNATNFNGMGMNAMGMNPFFGYEDPSSGYDGTVSGYDGNMGYDAAVGYTSHPLERDDSPLPEVDNSLFTSDFSFSSSTSTSSHSSTTDAAPTQSQHSQQMTAQDPTTTPPSIAPHDLPALDLDAARMGWAEVDPSLASSTSTCSASTATTASVTGSPAPSEEVLPEMGGMGMHGYGSHMHGAMGISPFDVVDYTEHAAHGYAMDMDHHSHMGGYGALSAEIGVDALIHAPVAKQAGSPHMQEKTPTATVFGDVHQCQRDHGHGQGQQQHFEPVFEDYVM